MSWLLLILIVSMHGSNMKLVHSVYTVCVINLSLKKNNSHGLSDQNCRSQSPD